MEEVAIPGRGEEHDLLKQFQAQYAAPAYVRRARRVEETYENLLHQCRQQRDQWLSMVRLRLGILQGLVGEWRRLLPLLKDEAQLIALESMLQSLQPRLRVAVDPTSSRRVHARALSDLDVSIRRFNERWREFIRTVDLTPVNELRAGYNRWYLLEKECAVRSARLARQGFVRLEMITHEDLANLFPLLPVVAMK